MQLMQYPFQIALRAVELTTTKRADIRDVLDTMNMQERTYVARHNHDDVVVYAFEDARNAELFCTRFDGRRIEN